MKAPRHQESGARQEGREEPVTSPSGPEEPECLAPGTLMGADQNMDQGKADEVEQAGSEGEQPCRAGRVRHAAGARGEFHGDHAGTHRHGDHGEKTEGGFPLPMDGRTHGEKVSGGGRRGKAREGAGTNLRYPLGIQAGGNNGIDTWGLVSRVASAGSRIATLGAQL